MKQTIQLNFESKCEQKKNQPDPSGLSCVGPCNNQYAMDPVSLGHYTTVKFSQNAIYFWSIGSHEIEWNYEQLAVGPKWALRFCYKEKVEGK